MAAVQVVGQGAALASNIDTEVIARLAAIMPCLEEQKKYGARSPTGLVSPRKQLFANAAKHNFATDFRTLAAKDARIQQRGERVLPQHMNFSPITTTNTTTSTTSPTTSTYSRIPISNYMRSY